jgi:hypothetical protein
MAPPMMIPHQRQQQRERADAAADDLLALRR